MTGNKKIIILVFLGILAIISLSYGITSLTMRQKEPLTVFSSVGGEQAALTPLNKVIISDRQAERTDYISWGRNPFSLQQVSVGLILNGILWDEEMTVAIINDVEVVVGDKIGGSEVIEIKPQSVILNNGSENFELELWTEE